jgi:hypothetical protein
MSNPADRLPGPAAPWYALVACSGVDPSPDQLRIETGPAADPVGPTPGPSRTTPRTQSWTRQAQAWTRPVRRWTQRVTQVYPAQQTMDHREDRRDRGRRPRIGNARETNPGGISCLVCHKGPQRPHKAPFRPYRGSYAHRPAGGSSKNLHRNINLYLLPALRIFPNFCSKSE